MGLAVFAPIPDFRYVGLEPIRARRIGAAATAFGLGAGVTLALSGFDSKHALVAGAAAAVFSAFALRTASGEQTSYAAGSARMRIVPWGVLVDTPDDGAPRILRWAAVRRVHVGVATDGASSRVVVETQHDRFVGEAIGAVRLERLVENLDAYAEEQSAPLALDLDGDLVLEEGVFGPECESIFGSAAGFLDSARGAAALDLPASGYRFVSTHARSQRAVDVLRGVLRDRTPKHADPRAFAAVLAAELHATDLVPDLVALAQCPHPLVAAFARQAARKLGEARSRTGTLEEIAPFLFDRDRAGLEEWVRSEITRL